MLAANLPLSQSICLPSKLNEHSQNHILLTAQILWCREASQHASECFIRYQVKWHITLHHKPQEPVVQLLVAWLIKVCCM